MTSDFDVPADWPQAFFTGPVNRFWEAMTSPEATSEDVRYVIGQLGLAAPARILDMPSGAGRHSLELARRGFTVLGVDASADAITRALQAADAEGLSAEFACGDMHAFATDRPFDGAICLGNSLGYSEAARTGAFFTTLAAAVRPGGRVVLDTGVCAESILPFQAQQRLTFEGGGYEAERVYDVRRSVLKTRARLALHGRSYDLLYSHAITTTGELVRQLEQAGFAVASMHADTAETPFSPGCPRLLMTAVRG